MRYYVRNAQPGLNTLRAGYITSFYKHSLLPKQAPLEGGIGRLALLVGRWNEGILGRFFISALTLAGLFRGSGLYIVM